MHVAYLMLLTDLYPVEQILPLPPPASRTASPRGEKNPLSDRDLEQNKQYGGGRNYANFPGATCHLSTNNPIFIRSSR
jgi:hypothetical protein